MGKFNLDPKQIITSKKPFIGYETYIVSIFFLSLSFFVFFKIKIPFTNFNLFNFLQNWFGSWLTYFLAIVTFYLALMALIRRKIHFFLISKLKSLILAIVAITILFNKQTGQLGVVVINNLQKIAIPFIWYIVAIFLFLIALSIFIWNSSWYIFIWIANKINASRNQLKNRENQTNNTSKILHSKENPRDIVSKKSSLKSPNKQSIFDLIQGENSDSNQINNIENILHPNQNQTIKNQQNLNPNYQLPSKEILKEVITSEKHAKNLMLAENLKQPLLNILKNFSIPAKIVNVVVGSTVTRYELEIPSGIKISRITSIRDNIKMQLAAKTLIIQAPIPGKSLIGIEIPNRFSSLVSFKSVIEEQPQNYRNNPLSCALGRNIEGIAEWIKINDSPHMLIAGATGAGKSICINTILASVLLYAKPQDVRLLLIDPKMVEFIAFDNIPHLLAPIITDTRKAAHALHQVVQDMEKRYKLFAEKKVRKIEDYNKLVTNKEKLPYILVVIDELADLMTIASKEVETSIARITQKARASGIHLIVATQRPSIDVITGLIKANIPTRISFAVVSAIDSRTILDSLGAEELLGKGDMLIKYAGQNLPHRCQGAFIDDEELAKITDEWKKQGFPIFDPLYLNLETKKASMHNVNSAFSDELYEEVKNFVISNQKASSSVLQRHFSIGYGRAARLIDALEAQGIVGPAQGSKARQVLIKK